LADINLLNKYKVKLWGCKKKFGEENRHFESWRGEKIDPLARIYTPD